ncbi:tetratricopeptide repeat protein [Brevundimonas sp.]
MVDVFEQVEEELRSDRYKRLARTWLPVVGGVLLIALIAALSWWGWDSWQTSKADKASVAYERGLESLTAGNPIGADAAFVQAINEGNGAYKALALQQRAQIALDANRIPDAIALLDEAADATRDPILSDFASLKAAWLVMDTSVTLADIEARLEPLTGDKRPYRYDARETLAMARLQHGKTAEARQALVLLKNDIDAPEAVGQRAGVIVEAIDSGAADNIRNTTDLMSSPTAAPTAPQGQAPTPAPASAPQAPPASQ